MHHVGTTDQSMFLEALKAHECLVVLAKKGERTLEVHDDGSFLISASLWGKEDQGIVCTAKWFRM